MVSTLFPLHVAGTVFCFISSILIAYQTFKHPNKLRAFILGYSIITLPAIIINTLQIEDMVAIRTNSLVYLFATLLMTLSHFYMLLDVGYRLRVGEANFKHPLVTIGVIFEVATLALLLTEAALLIKMDDPSAPDFNPYPLKWAFIVGVVVALISDCAVFTFTFLPLIYWKKNRTNEGHSRTTAIGIWFFVIQNVWYMFYGALYIWFFIGNTWDNLTMLLLIDYCLRFVENLMYTWPPPVKVINYLSTQLPSTSIQLSNTRRSGQNSSAYDHTSIKILSSEQYNKEMKTEYSPHEQEDKLGLPKKSAHSVISEEHANPYAIYR